jgi:hypothetical protein
VEYVDYIRALRSTHAQLADELSAFRGLGSVLAWLKRRGIPLAKVEIVQQDECSLDFILPLDSSAAHLVFGIT